MNPTREEHGDKRLRFLRVGSGSCHQVSQQGQAEGGGKCRISNGGVRQRVLIAALRSNVAAGTIVCLTNLPPLYIPLEELTMGILEELLSELI